MIDCGETQVSLNDWQTSHICEEMQLIMKNEIGLEYTREVKIVFSECRGLLGIAIQ